MPLYDFDLFFMTQGEICGQLLEDMMEDARADERAQKPYLLNSTNSVIISAPHVPCSCLLLLYISYGVRTALLFAFNASTFP